MPESPSSIRSKVVLGFFLAFIAIGVLGYISYNTLEELVESISEEARPSERLGLLREILNDLSDAESSVRAYTITGEASYLKPYYQSVTVIDEKLANLRETKEGRLHAARMDSLQDLVEQKFESLQSLIEIKNDANTLSILQQVLQDLESLDSTRLDSLYAASMDSIDKIEFDTTEATASMDSVQVEQKKKGWGIFRKLFGGGNKKEEEKAAEERLSGEGPDVDSLREVQDSVRVIKAGFDLAGYIAAKVASLEKQQLTKQENQALKELELTRRDQAIMAQINTILSKMEREELADSRARADSARVLTKKTTNLGLAIVGGAVLIFLILLYRIFVDITRNNRNRKALREAMEKTEMLARAKEEFLSNMSHEIRTPLHAIIGFADQLSQTALDKEQQEQMEMIGKSSTHLQMLINDILDYSKLNSGKLHLESTGFMPLRQAEQVRDMLLPQASQKDIDFLLDSRGMDDIILLGDPLRLQQLLINLCSNAIKFTDEGHVRIRMEGSTQRIDGEQRFLLILSVEDTGIGIPEEKQEEIFENFNQADNSTTRRYGGTGLGLAIVKKLVDLHEGTIRLESSPGKGSTFTIRLQYTEGRASDLQEEVQVLPQQSGQLFAGCRLLVADDEPYNLALIEQIARKWGAAVTCASNGREAWEAYQKETFDAVLTDVQMPEMNGYELTRAIRTREQEEARTAVPVLALSAESTAELSGPAIEAGMDGHLLKPFREKDLIALLDKHLTTKEYMVARPEQESQNKTEEAQALKIDLEGLYAIAGDNMDFISNMLSLFVKNASPEIEEMRVASKGKDWNRVARISHKMAAPARHLGMDDLVKLLKALETGIDEGSLSAKARGPLVEEATVLASRYVEAVRQELIALKEA